jgi:hypothetical protein
MSGRAGCGGAFLLSIVFWLTIGATIWWLL